MMQFRVLKMLQLNLLHNKKVTKPFRLCVLVLLLLLAWLLYTYHTSGPGDTDTHDVAHPAVVEPPTTAEPDPRLVVDVYYEVLCPDSRYFVLTHLLPAVERVGSLMEVRLWPYGKATTQRTETGLSFQCQHGP